MNFVQFDLFQPPVVCTKMMFAAESILEMESNVPCCVPRDWNILDTSHWTSFIRRFNVGDRFTKVIVNRKSKITLKISLRARIRAFH